MSMKSMAKKKMGGFMCHSPAATAVCMTPDSRSVIIPGRRSAAERNITATSSAFSNGTNSDHNERLLFNTVKYSKLIDYHHNHRNHRRPPHHNHHYQSQTKFISTNGSGSTNNKTVILPNNSMIKREQALRTVLSSGTTSDQQQIRPLDLQRPSSVLDSVPDRVFQVVVMRVSLHCQGCAGKLKKHLSKMEGVTSFSIELETKRVTVMGHVSPAGVLESINSKVRRAEFWPSSFPADHPQ